MIFYLNISILLREVARIILSSRPEHKGLIESTVTIIKELQSSDHYIAGKSRKIYIFIVPISLNLYE